MKVNLKSLSEAILTKRVVKMRASCEDISKEIGVSKPTISRVENEKMPDLITYVKLCKWLGVSLDKFIEVE